MREHLSGEQPLTVAKPQSKPYTNPPGQKKHHEPLQGCSLADLAAAKGLDPEWLASELGWRDGWYYPNRNKWPTLKTPSVEMPYYGESGREVQVRYRVGLTGEDRFRANGKQVPYGLWNLPHIREQGWALIVEGETDFATCYYHGFPVVGLPGAAHWNIQISKLLEGLEIYVVREPDQGGTTLYERVRATNPNAFIINASADAKDPNAMYLQHRIDFYDFFSDLVCQAEPFPQPEKRKISYENEKIGGWFLYQKQVTFYREMRGTPIKDYLLSRKKDFIDAMPTNTPVERARKSKIELCFENFYLRECLNLHEQFYTRYRCGEPMCPICAPWLIDKFFTQEHGEEKLTKEEILRANATEPTIYQVTLGGVRLSPEAAQKHQILVNLNLQIKGMWKHLKDNEGDQFRIAKDFIRGQRVKFDRDDTGAQVIFSQLLLMGDREPGAMAMLRKHFSREVGLAVDVEEVICHGATDARRNWAGLMAVRADWFVPDDYWAWRQATKGTKIMQGLGVFTQITGGMPKRKGQEDGEGDCPCCGFCKPADLGGVYPVESTEVEQVVSEITGRTYLRALPGAVSLYG
jgi:hypothetical protein